MHADCECTWITVVSQVPCREGSVFNIFTELGPAKFISDLEADTQKVLNLYLTVKRVPQKAQLPLTNRASAMHFFVAKLLT